MPDLSGPGPEILHGVSRRVNQLIEYFIHVMYLGYVSDVGSVVLILDAAEELFAQQGFDATSIRAVTRHAGMNPAAVHYHFGSKEVLLRALLERRIAPLNEERLLLLDHVLRDGEPDLERLLDAYLRPVLRHADAAAGALTTLLFELPEEMDPSALPRRVSNGIARIVSR